MSKINYDAMSSIELEAHIKSVIAEHKEDVKALRALLRVKQRDEQKSTPAETPAQ